MIKYYWERTNQNMNLKVMGSENQTKPHSKKTLENTLIDLIYPTSSTAITSFCLIHVKKKLIE